MPKTAPPSFVRAVFLCLPISHHGIDDIRQRLPLGYAQLGQRVDEARPRVRRVNAQHRREKVRKLLFAGLCQKHFAFARPQPALVHVKLAADGKNDSLRRFSSALLIACNGIPFNTKPLAEFCLRKSSGFSYLFNPVLRVIHLLFTMSFYSEKLAVSIFFLKTY